MAGRRMTLAERIARYLVEGQGMVERQPRGRWRWFTGPMGGNYFVGRAGAVRSGATISSSVSLTDIVRAQMELWERKEGKMT